MSEIGANRTPKSETLAKAVLAIKTGQDFVIFLRSLMSAVLAGEVGVKEANAVMIMADRMLNHYTLDGWRCLAVSIGHKNAGRLQFAKENCRHSLIFGN